MTVVPRADCRFEDGPKGAVMANCRFPHSAPKNVLWLGNAIMQSNPDPLPADSCVPAVAKTIGETAKRVPVPAEVSTEPQELPFVVAIFARRECGSLEFLGTGTVIDPFTVLTCRHVVEDSESLDSAPELQPALVIRSVDDTYTEIAGGQLDPELDLAVLCLKSPLAVDPVVFATGLDQRFINHLDRLDLRILGYPAASGGIRQSTFTNLKMQLLKSSTGGGWLQTLQVHGGIDEGCSGGPALVQSDGAWQCFAIAYLGGGTAASSRVICADAVVGSELLAGSPDRANNILHRPVDLQRLKQHRAPTRSPMLFVLISLFVLAIVAAGAASLTGFTTRPKQGDLQITDVIVHPRGARRYRLDFRVHNQGDAEVQINRATLIHVSHTAPAEYQDFSRIYASNIDLAQLAHGQGECVLSQKVTMATSDRFAVDILASTGGDYTFVADLHTNFGVKRSSPITIKVPKNTNQIAINAITSDGVFVSDGSTAAKVSVVDGVCYLVVDPNAPPPDREGLQDLGFFETLANDSSIVGIAVLTNTSEPLALSDDWLAALCAIPSIRNVRFQGTRVTDNSCAALARLTELETLHLSNAQIGLGALSSLPQAARIKELTLEDCRVEEGNVALLSKWTSLKVLGLLNCGLTPKDLPSLAAMRQLTTLDLRGTTVNETTIADLLTQRPDLVIYWSNVHSVSTIRLTALQITNGWLERLQPFPSLQTLDLRDTTLTQDQIDNLATAPQLKSLVLDRTNIDDAMLSTLAKVKTLESLRLCDTQFSKAGLDAIVNLQRLKYLNLAGVSGISAEDVATAKKRLPAGCKVMDSPERSAIDEN
jgi:hypothetical protein